MSILKGVKTLDVCKNLISYYNGTNAAMLQFTVPFSLRNGREEHKVLPKVMMRVKEFFKDISEGGGGFTIYIKIGTAEPTLSVT